MPELTTVQLTKLTTVQTHNGSNDRTHNGSNDRTHNGSTTLLDSVQFNQFYLTIFFYGGKILLHRFFFSIFCQKGNLYMLGFPSFPEIATWQKHQLTRKNTVEIFLSVPKESFSILPFQITKRPFLDFLIFHAKRTTVIQRKSINPSPNDANLCRLKILSIGQIEKMRFSIV